MPTLERPDNWPFQSGQTWGTNPENLKSWDRAQPYVTEEEVFTVWAAMRKRYGGARISDYSVMESNKTIHHIGLTRCLFALSVLRDAGWVLQWGRTDRGPLEAVGIKYQALAPDEIGMTHADMPMTESDKYWLSVLVSVIVGALIVGLAFSVRCVG